jgi:hypothetical protein
MQLLLDGLQRSLMHAFLAESASLCTGTSAPSKKPTPSKATLTPQALRVVARSRL